VPKGDPGNTLDRQELEEKFRRLAEFRGGASAEETERLIEEAWTLDQQPVVRHLMRDA
jgi:2-methylcitrate dehydratase PrpD